MTFFFIGLFACQSTGNIRLDAALASALGLYPPSGGQGIFGGDLDADVSPLI